MFRIISTKNHRFQGCMNTLLTTDLLAHVFLLVLLYVGIQVIAVYTFDHFMPEGVDPKWLRAMDGIQLIIGFIYYIWIKEAMDGYTASPALYRKIINIILSFAEKFVSLHAHCTDKEIDGKVFQPVRECCIALIVYAYQMFDPYDPDDSEDSNPAAKEVAARTAEVRNVIEAKDEADLRSTQWIIRDLNMLLQTLIQADFIRAKENQEGIICETNLQDLGEIINTLSSTIDEIDISAAVPGPTLFTSHIQFTLFFYFVVWFPFFLWGTLGTVGSLVLYPLTMLILTGIPVYRAWMGDPFDHDRPISLIEYDEWKDDFRDRINSIFGHDEGDNGNNLTIVSIPGKSARRRHHRHNRRYVGQRMNPML